MSTIIVDGSAPGTSHLDGVAVRRLRDALLADRSARVALVRDADATARELTGQADVDSILEREVADASADRAREAITDIDGALARMDVGTYGRCEACGATIPLERLEVVPHARWCVACGGRQRGILG